MKTQLLQPPVQSILSPSSIQGLSPLASKREFITGPVPSLEQQTIYYDFGNYKTYFVCSGTASVGAQTYDNQNRLIAEAKLVRYISYQLVGSSLIIDEIHYDSNGQPIFKCTSQIDSGFKTNELNVVGTKIIDYYSVWRRPIEVLMLLNYFFCRENDTIDNPTGLNYVGFNIEL